jgi:hypothetical protein
MQIESKIISIINDKLKNPIYETLRLLNMKTILTKSNFSKKEGVAVHMVVLHFVYMLVMNKKISTFMDQSNDSFKKDVYYRLLANAHYNWRKLLSLSSLKILSLLHKVQDAKLVRVLILDDTVEDKVGKNIEGSCDNLWSNKAKRKIRGVKHYLSYYQKFESIYFYILNLSLLILQFLYNLVFQNLYFLDVYIKFHLLIMILQ